ncbi:MAG: hypothetical protein WC824_11945, partial [Bacteroidota bacterium]
MPSWKSARSRDYCAVPALNHWRFGQGHTFDMTIASPHFLFLIAALLFLFHARANTRYRQMLIAGGSMVFIGSYAANPLELVPLAVFVVGGYGLVRAAAQSPSARVMAVLIAGYVLAFMYIKQYAVLTFMGTAFSEPYVTLGASYILFRVL